MLRTQNLHILYPSTLSAAPKMADALMDMYRQCFRRLTEARKKKNSNNNNNNNNNNDNNLTHSHLLNLHVSYNITGLFFIPSRNRRTER